MARRVDAVGSAARVQARPLETATDIREAACYGAAEVRGAWRDMHDGGGRRRPSLGGWLGDYSGRKPEKAGECLPRLLRRGGHDVRKPGEMDV